MHRPFFATLFALILLAPQLVIGQDTDRVKGPFDDAAKLHTSDKVARKTTSNISSRYPLLLTKLPVDEKASELRRLRVERHNAAVGEISARMEEYVSGRSSIVPVGAAAERVIKSALALKLEDSRHVKMLTEYVDLSKHLESLAKMMFESGTSTAQEVQLARYVRINAEIKKLRFLKKIKSDKKEKSDP